MSSQNNQENEGGCLCGALRYKTIAAPARVTYCHCKFCQRATGGAYLVEPLFPHEHFEVIKGTPKTYDLISSGSKKGVRIHFCDNCGTKLYMTFERFEGITGIFGGTYDDPDWFDRSPENAKHIFLNYAQKGTVIPAGMPTFGEHASNSDGTMAEPEIFDLPKVLGHD